MGDNKLRGSAPSIFEVYLWSTYSAETSRAEGNLSDVWMEWFLQKSHVILID
jgi:hypothetical protein